MRMHIYSKARARTHELGAALIELLWACIVFTAVVLIGARCTMLTLQAMARAAGWV